MNTFSLSFAADDDGEPNLIAILDTGEFKGQCFYRCPPTEFADLVPALKKYPIARDHPIDERLYDGCIALRIEPINSVGLLSVQVSLQEYSSDWNKCQSQFHSSYGELSSFCVQLEGVIASGVGDAILSSV